MIHPSPRDQRDVPHNRDVPPSSSSASFTSPPKKKTIDKQSVDYVLRSGLAGGLAGCAVSARSLLVSTHLFIFSETDLRHPTRSGQIPNRATRPRQDPLPSILSAIHSLRRLLCWPLHRPPQHISPRRHQWPLPWSFRYSPPHLPLRSDQIPCLRTNPPCHHPQHRPRNPTAPIAQWQSSWRHQRPCHLPSRSDSSAVSLRDRQRTAQRPRPDLQDTLPRATAARTQHEQ